MEWTRRARSGFPLSKLRPLARSSNMDLTALFIFASFIRKRSLDLSLFSFGSNLPPSEFWLYNGGHGHTRAYPRVRARPHIDASTSAHVHTGSTFFPLNHGRLFMMENEIPRSRPYETFLLRFVRCELWEIDKTSFHER
jgi:hypothetical protein